RSGVPDFRVDTPGDGGWIADRLRGTELSPFDAVSMERILETISGLDVLDFEPGARYAYSNTNYMLLRAAAERAGRAPFAAQVERLGERLAGVDIHAPVYRDGMRQPPSQVVGYDVAENGTAPAL